MRIRLVVALVGLAISFALPTFAQQKDTADPQIIDQLNALSKKTNDAFNNGRCRRPGCDLHAGRGPGE
jgi:hypothetical protein